MTIQAERETITTGEAARLCGVTPDTILKWIKKGRLKSGRTAGGHHRVREDDIRSLISASRSEDSFQEEPAAARNSHMCWEYLNPAGNVPGECRNCLVYRAKAAYCFELVQIAADIGHGRRFCATGCEDCAYYRLVHGMATRVLVVTADETLMDALREEPNQAVEWRPARNAYEASTVVEQFHPAFAVIDCALPGLDELAQCLAHDCRAPGLRLIAAVRRRERLKALRDQCNDFLVGALEKPFDWHSILTLLENVPVGWPLNGRPAGK